MWRLQLRPSYNQAGGARRAPFPSPSPCPRRFQDPVGGEGHPGRPKDRPGSQRATGGQLKSFLLCVCAQSLSCDLTRFLGPWDFPGRNTGVGCHFLLQGIFLTQESNPHPWHLLLSQWILYHCTTWEASFKLLKHSLYHW